MCVTLGTRSASKDLLNLIEDSTKELEMVIDILWIVNITLMFITPVEQELMYQYRFIDIAK